MKRVLIFICIFNGLTSLWAQDQMSVVNYLALGDSYTMGESVKEDDCWPNQLAVQLDDSSQSFNVEIIAKTGWTTDDLINAMNEEELDLEYDLVSLLIGVNNQYQSKPFDQYREEFPLLLNKALSLVKNDKNRVFVVGIPDYSVTPFAKEMDGQNISEEIKRYNQYALTVCKEQNILFVDIFDLSRKLDDNWFASDGLHPSGTQYKTWSDLIKVRLAARLKYLD